VLFDGIRVQQQRLWRVQAERHRMRRRHLLLQQSLFVSTARNLPLAQGVTKASVDRRAGRMTGGGEGQIPALPGLIAAIAAAIQPRAA
jgi:hypothetical protein